MDNINSNSENQFFDLNENFWEQDLAKSENASFESFGGRNAEGQPKGSWEDFSKKLNASEDELCREEMHGLGESLSGYTTNFSEPDWEGFKEKLDSKVRKRHYFFFSKAAEVYLLVVFCSLLGFWGGKTGFFLRESSINWDKIMAFNPFAGSQSIWGENDSPALDHQIKQNAKQHFVSNNIITGSRKEVENAMLLPSFLLLESISNKPLTGKMECLSEESILSNSENIWNNESPKIAFNTSQDLAPVKKTVMSVSPYFKLHGVSSIMNFNTALVNGDFGRNHMVWGGGVNAGVTIGERVNVETGVNYQKMNYAGVSENGNQLDIISIPVRVGYKVSEVNNKTSVHVFGGVNANTIISGDFEELIHVSPKYPLTAPDYLENPADLGRTMVVEEGVKPRNQFATISVGLGVERKIDSTATVFASAVYTSSLGKGFGQNFERMNGVGVELGVKINI